MTLTLSTGSAGGPCRYGGTHGVLKECSGVAQGYSGGTQGYSGGTVGFGVQAFRLQGLAQSARAKAPCPSRSSLGQRRLERHHRTVCSLQIFSDMQRELGLMTTPKHKNVLRVHGMYALGGSVRRREVVRPRQSQLMLARRNAQRRDSSAPAAGDGPLGHFCTQSARRPPPSPQGRECRPGPALNA